MKNKLAVITVYLAAAILDIVGPHSLFRVCEAMGDKVMKCHWSVHAEFAIAIVWIGIAALYALTKTAREKALLSAAAIVNSVASILIPAVLIGGCSMMDMACQSRTFPAFYVIAIIVILVSGINILLQRKSGAGRV